MKEIVMGSIGYLVLTLGGIIIFAILLVGFQELFG